MFKQIVAKSLAWTKAVKIRIKPSVNIDNDDVIMVNLISVTA